MDGAYEPGIRRHWRQLLLQVLTVLAVGFTMGVERPIVPTMADEELGIESLLLIGTCVVSFGIVKAIPNLSSGRWVET